MTHHIHRRLLQLPSHTRRAGWNSLGIAFAFALAWLTSPVQAASTLGESVVKDMHARYRNAWYDTTSFTQKTTTYHLDGTSTVETWYERAKFPGQLRVDIGPTADGHTFVMTAGNLYTFEQGTLTGSRPLLSLALVLGFDVYRQPPDITLSQLQTAGIDTSKAHLDVWHGQSVYVVGTTNGTDLTHQQFWVDADRLLLVRLIIDDPRQPGALADIRFLNYKLLPRGLIATKIEVRRDRRLVMQEDYTDIKIDMPLDPATFDPAQLTPSSGS
jgi:hypothetical protein